MGGFSSSYFRRRFNPSSVDSSLEQPEPPADSTTAPGSIEEEAAARNASLFGGGRDSRVGAGAGRGPAAGPEDRSFLRKSWDVVSSPLRAATGLTGTSLVNLLGIRALFPEQYQKAHEELLASESGRAGPEILNEAAALPGLGDVIAAGVPDEMKESLPGRILTPIGKLAGNILGDPLTYVGGAGAIARASKAEKFVEAARVAEVAGDAATSAAALERATSIMRSLSPLERGANRFMAAQGVAYAPDLAESVATGATDAYEAARAGRYAEAAASGAGALLTGGMGLLVARGVIHEVQAAQALERALGDRLGESSRPAVPGAPGGAPGEPGPVSGAARRPVIPPEPQPVPAPGAGATAGGGPLAPAVPPAAPEGVPGAVPGAAPEGAPPAAGGVNAVLPASTATESGQPVRSPVADRIKVQPTPEIAQQLADMFAAKAEKNQYLTKKDLIDAGLVTPKQAKSYPLEALLDALGGTHLRGQLESAPGLGFRIKAAEPMEAEPIVEPEPAVPAGAPAAGPVVEPGQAPVVPVATAPAAAPPAPVPAAPAAPARPAPIARTEIDRQLEDPKLRQLVHQTLENIAEGAGKKVGELTKTDVAAFFPQDADKPTRALMNRALYARQKEERELAKAAAGPSLEDARAAVAEAGNDSTSVLQRRFKIGFKEAEKLQSRLREQGPQAALTFPGEGRQPYGGYERRARDAAHKGASNEGIPAERVRESLSEEDRAAAETGIRNHDEYLVALREHGRIRRLIDQQPHLADELKPMQAALEDQLIEAQGHGHHLERGMAAAPEGTREYAAEPPRVRHEVEGIPVATQAAVRTLLESSKIPTKTFVERAQKLIGKPLDQATGDELNLVYTLAHRQPEAFGAPARTSRLDPDVTMRATRNLIGDLSHLENKEYGRANQLDPNNIFTYNPASPAGDAQDLARRLERQGVPAEQHLQDAITRWITGLSQDDERHIHAANTRALTTVEKAAEVAQKLEAEGRVDEGRQLRASAVEKAQKQSARGQRAFESAQKLRALLTSEDPVAVKDELARMLKGELSHKKVDYFRRESGARPVDDLIAKSMGEGLTQAEQSRLSAPAEEPAPAAPTDAEAAARRALGVDIPKRPAGVDAVAWREQVRSTPAIMQRYSQTLDKLAQDWIDSERAVGGARETGGGSVMTRLKDIGEQLGITIPKKRGAGQLIPFMRKMLEREPRAASNFLTDEIVAKRGPVWRKAIADAPTIGDTGARAVDFEKDAGALIPPTLEHGGPLAEELVRVVNDLGNQLDLTSRFGGFTPSPQLQGLRLDDGIFLNHYHARHLAESSVREMEAAGPGLTPESRSRLVEYKTAQNLLDVALHEIAHKRAGQEAGHGADFVKAYRDAITEAGPLYGEAIRRLRDASGTLTGSLEKTMPEYLSALNKLKLEVRGGAERSGAGAGSSVAAADRGGPGGGAGGAADRAELGVQPGGAVRAGGAGAAEGVRAGAGVDEGAAGIGAGEAGGAGGLGAGVGGGEEPVASLTTRLTGGVRARQRERMFQQMGTLFAHNMARYTGDPADATRYLHELDMIQKLSPEQRAALRTARPQGEIDIGKNLTKFPTDAMSDEQKEQLGLALAMRNHMMSRYTPMSEADVHAAARRLLDSHTPEEFIDFAKTKGLRDPADWALLDSIAATFSKDVDSEYGKLRAAAIGGAPQEEITAISERLAQAKLKRDEAIFTAIPETTRIARVMAFRRGIVRPLTEGETFRSRFLGVMRASGIKKEQQEGFYRMLMDTVSQGPGADWTAFQTAFRRATQPKWYDKALEFWKAGLLGIPTQITNVGSNAMFLGLRNAENAVTGLVQPFFSGLTGKPRERFVGETAARMQGGKVGLREAGGALWDELKQIAKLQAPDFRARLEQGTFFDDPNLRQLYGAIEGKKGEFIRIPFKLLDTFDNFFKHIIRNQEWSARANRLAQAVENRSTPGEPIAHATARIFDELRRAASDPITNNHLYRKPGYKEAIEAGRTSAIIDTFQQSLSGTALRDAARSYQRATNQLPALQLITPFFKTPYNILAEGMKRTPIGAAWAIKNYAAGKIDNPAFVEDMVKSAIGTAIMGTAFEAAMNGNLTGGGPTDPKEREILKATGWQPRSFKVGGTYYQYQRFAPFSMLLGMAADMAEAYKRKDLDTANEQMAKGVASATDNVMDQSFVQGVDSLVKILTSPEKEGATAVRQLEASLVPNTVGVVPVAHLTRGIDPLYRETEAYSLSPIQAQIPGLSQMLPPQRTPTGEVRERKGTPLERMFSPVLRSEEETGPVADASAEISRLGGPIITAPPPFFRVGNDKVYYTEQEREELARVQQQAVARVGQIIRSGGYQRLPDNEAVGGVGKRSKIDAIRETIDAVRGPITDRIRHQALRRARAETISE